MKSRVAPRTITITALLGTAACGNARPRDASAEAEYGCGGFEPRRGRSETQPIGASGAGSTVVLARSNGRRVAFIADEDAKAVLTFDVDTQQQLASTRVGGVPSQVFVARDGRVFVTVRDKSKLVALEVDTPDAPLRTIHETPTPAEPVAIASTPDEKTMLVTAGWAQKLAAFDSTTLAPRFETKLPREPRGVVVSDDGARAFVSHAVGSVVSVVDLAGPKHATSSIAMRGSPIVRPRISRFGAEAEQLAASTFARGKHAAEGRQGCQGFVLAKSAAIENRIFAPQVMVDTGDPEQRPSGYGDSATIPEMPSVAVIDEGAAMPLEASLTSAPTNIVTQLVGGRDPRTTTGACLLPRSAAIDPQTKSLLVTCFGIDAVVAYDASSASPAFAPRRQWNVGAGPSGIAVDALERQAVVFSQFDRTISVIALGGSERDHDRSAPAPVEKTTLASIPDGVSPQLIVGRMLFHASGDIRIASDGRACASCHPDGRDDAITWATPEGPRRSIMLAGRVSKTPPYSWDGNAATIEAHLGATFQRLRGHGLRSAELDALVTYVSSLPAPPARAVDDAAKVERGRRIFTSRETGCSSCHAGESFTDGTSHDVGSKHTADVTEKFNTPSLRLVGGIGPYFHDGRYATLGELLRKTDGTMGHTKHLTNADIDALQSYLETL
jgi:DNA-binding beta-propeller fold protein YncE/mono/diheme cytochrome c family protein